MSVSTHHPAAILTRANMQWLKLLTPLKKEEIRQRENKSDFNVEDAKPVDAAAVDSLARDSWDLAYQPSQTLVGLIRIPGNVRLPPGYASWRNARRLSRRPLQRRRQSPRQGRSH